MLTVQKLELISDKAALFFLNQFDSGDESVERVKISIQRKIDGKNPLKRELSYLEDAIDVAKTFDIGRSRAQACACASDIYIAIAITNAMASDNGNDNGRDNAKDYEKRTAKYIIELLGDDLIAIPELNKRVLAEINKEANSLDMGRYHKNGFCGTTHCRGGFELVIHPQGKILEEHLGAWMAATVIHYKCEGDFVDYFDKAENVMKDLNRNS